MTHIKDAKPEPLTAEREAALREWVSGVNRPDTPTTRWWQRDVAQLFATLDAARAETEAVRRERDDLKLAADAWRAVAEEGIAILTAERATLRDLIARAQGIGGGEGEPGAVRKQEGIMSPGMFDGMWEALVTLVVILILLAAGVGFLLGWWLT